MTPDAPDLKTKWPGVLPADSECPVLRLAEGPELKQPKARDLARLLGLQTSAKLPTYDTMVIGGGPAALAAAGHGTSRRLRTWGLAHEAPGRPYATTSRTQNVL